MQAKHVKDGQDIEHYVCVKDKDERRLRDKDKILECQQQQFND